MKRNPILPRVMTAVGGLWTAFCLCLMMNSLQNRPAAPELGPATTQLILTFLSLPGVLLLILGIIALPQNPGKR